jgi:hypothetical protein
VNNTFPDIASFLNREMLMDSLNKHPLYRNDKISTSVIGTTRNNHIEIPENFAVMEI